MVAIDFLDQKSWHRQKKVVLALLASDIHQFIAFLIVTFIPMVILHYSLLNYTLIRDKLATEIIRNDKLRQG